MESHNEERFKLEEKTKMIQAKKKADEERKRLDKKRREDSKFGIGSGGGSMEHISNSYSTSSPAPRSTFGNEPIVDSKKESPRIESKSSTKGLQLGRGKKTTGYSQVLKEENVQDIETTASPSTPISSGLVTQKERVQVSILEKIALVCENDGGLKSMEIKGELIVTTFDAQYSQVQIHVNQSETKDFQFKAHPNMNKNLYSQNQILALKDSTKSYPVGSPTGVLKWRWATKEEKYIPLIINVWPSSSGGETTVPVEYEKKCDFDLTNVVVSIPIPGASPVVGEAVGSYDYDPKKGILYWRIPLIDNDNRTGSLEFTVPQASNSQFFPVQVSFTSKTTFASIQVLSVTGNNQEKVEYATEVNLSVEQYDIES